MIQRKQRGGLRPKKRKVGLNNRVKRKDNNAIINGGLDVNQFIKTKHHDNSFLHNGSPVARMILKLMNHTKYQDQRNATYKRYNSQQFVHTTIEHLAYKGLTHDDKEAHYFDHSPMGSRHYLILADDLQQTSGYAEILKIGGASLSDLPTNLILERMSMFINFLRSYKTNMEFVALPLPNNSKPQQHIWNEQLKHIRRTLLEDTTMPANKRAQLIAREVRVKENLEKFHETDTNLVNQGFVLIIFEMGRSPNTIRKLDDDVRLAFRFGSDALNLSRLTANQKESFLRHLNNPADVKTM